MIINVIGIGWFPLPCPFPPRDLMGSPLLPLLSPSPSPLIPIPPVAHVPPFIHKTAASPAPALCTAPLYLPEGTGQLLLCHFSLSLSPPAAHLSHLPICLYYYYATTYLPAPHHFIFHFVPLTLCPCTIHPSIILHCHCHVVCHHVIPTCLCSYATTYLP